MIVIGNVRYDVNSGDAHGIFCPDLLQVLSIIAMERPVSFSAEDIRDEKVCLAI